MNVNVGGVMFIIGVGGAFGFGVDVGGMSVKTMLSVALGNWVDDGADGVVDGVEGDG